MPARERLYAGVSAAALLGVVALLGAVLPPLLDAARTLYAGQTAQDRLRRQTIQTQLEATTWARFADITP